MLNQYLLEMILQSHIQIKRISSISESETWKNHKSLDIQVKH